jgi:hypothetical protein
MRVGSAAVGGRPERMERLEVYRRGRRVSPPGQAPLGLAAGELGLGQLHQERRPGAVEPQGDVAHVRKGHGGAAGGGRSGRFPHMQEDARAGTRHRRRAVVGDDGAQLVAPVLAQHVFTGGPVAGLRRPIDEAVVVGRGRVVHTLQVRPGAVVGQAGRRRQRACVGVAKQGSDGEHARRRPAIALALFKPAGGGMQAEPPGHATAPQGNGYFIANGLPGVEGSPFKTLQVPGRGIPVRREAQQQLGGGGGDHGVRCHG